MIKLAVAAIVRTVYDDDYGSFYCTEQSEITPESDRTAVIVFASICVALGVAADVYGFTTLSDASKGFPTDIPAKFAEVLIGVGALSALGGLVFFVHEAAHWNLKRSGPAALASAGLSAGGSLAAFGVYLALYGGRPMLLYPIFGLAAFILLIFGALRLQAHLAPHTIGRIGCVESALVVKLFRLGDSPQIIVDPSSMPLGAEVAVSLMTSDRRQINLRCSPTVFPTLRVGDLGRATVRGALVIGFKANEYRPELVEGATTHTTAVTDLTQDSQPDV